jgi:predicted Rossmann fold nucleotide-binding protein DprA/Smf involved in DNA uptake
MAKILITGTRKTNNVSFVFEKLNQEVDKTKDIIIHGGAEGIDSIAESWCKQNNVNSIIIRPIYPSQKIYYLHRNAEMIGMADKVIAFWDGESKGTKFTYQYAQKRGKELKIFKL